jgi:phosphopantothenoylcysteine decarboxylase
MSNIILGVSGSVAAVLTGKLAKALMEFGEVRVVFTEKGYWFIEHNKKAKKEWQEALEAGAQKFVDDLEWPVHYEVGDEILHIELRKWADCMVLAPMSANTMAKIRYGLCDNLLTCVARAWDFKRNGHFFKPFIIAPAMNTQMWNNDPTNDHICELAGRGVRIVTPVEKELACGETGIGAMAPIEEIMVWTKQALTTYSKATCSNVS